MGLYDHTLGIRRVHWAAALIANKSRRVFRIEGAKWTTRCSLSRVMQELTELLGR